MRRRLDTVVRLYALASVVGWVMLVAFVLGTVSNVTTARGADATSAGAPAIHLEHRRDARQTSVDAVSGTVMCPSCDTTLDQSNSPAAARMRAYVTAAVAAGWTADEIRDGLVHEYGGDESILAVPRARGIGLLAWVVPALVVGVALIGGVVLMRRWRGQSGANPGAGDASG
jgi:cytochrome c-type biogenesis protein CcmH/NrfF